MSIESRRPPQGADGTPAELPKPATTERANGAEPNGAGRDDRTAGSFHYPVPPPSPCWPRVFPGL
jgi:hypothetical protein